MVERREILRPRRIVYQNSQGRRAWVSLEGLPFSVFESVWRMGLAKSAHPFRFVARRLIERQRFARYQGSVEGEYAVAAIGERDLIAERAGLPQSRTGARHLSRVRVVPGFCNDAVGLR